MHLEVLVEEPSAEAALRNLLPKLLGEAATFSIHAYQCKKDLMKKLPRRLKGYKKWIPPDYKIIILVDQDRENCRKLKEKMEKIAEEAGLLTKSKAGKPCSFTVINRIAVEELEAWFFGDLTAVAQAFPGVPENLGKKRQYRKPDSIPHTWEALWRVLRNAGYYRKSYPKIEAARKISEKMNPQKNNSPSFNAFKRALEELKSAECAWKKQPKQPRR